MNPQWVVFHGDALDLLRTVPDGSVDSIVTDPPAGISFMGREWDHHKGGRDQWIAWLTEITRECLRVLKPGGHALFWALPKTSHWTATAVEDGGFELRDVITHHFGCLSDDTEILVDGKWRTYAEATQGRSALCYDAERDLFFWGPIQDLFVYQYDDTAYTVRGDRTDQLVTREHRCTVERGSTVVFETAENLARQREARIPVLEDVQSLLGCLPRPDEGASCQEPALRTRVPRQEHTTTTNGAVLQTRFGLSSLWQAVQTSKQSASESKVLQHSVRGSESCRGPLFQKTPEGDRWSRSISLDRRQYDELPEKDDGTRESGVERRGHVQETARQLRGCEAREVPGRVSGDEGEQRVRPGTPSCCSQDLGSVFDATGSCAPHRLRPEKQPPLEPHAVCLPARSQAVRASRFTSSDLVRFEPVHYQGIVWCVRVATGAFVARRNGHVFVTGNSGMPKSADASKMIDKKLGTTSQRQVFATYTAGGNAGTSTKDKGGTYGVGVANSEPVELSRTTGGSPEARQWDGFGTGLKPSSEHWILARKPLAGTLADNLLRHGAGALNIDGCRVGTDWNEPDRPASWAASGHSAKPEADKIAAPPGIGMQLHPGGRWKRGKKRAAVPPSLRQRHHRRRLRARGLPLHGVRGGGTLRGHLAGADRVLGGEENGVVLTRAAVITPPHLLRDYFHEPVLVLRVANLDDIETAKGRDELDAADRDALRRRQYVVIYDGVRQRICHVGFLRKRKTVEELLGRRRPDIQRRADLARSAD